MPTLPFHRSRSRFVLLLLPIAAALAPSCSHNTGVSGDFSDGPCDECGEDGTGFFSSSSGGGAGIGGAGGAAPMDVCPTGSLPSLDPCTPSSPSCNVSSLCMAPIDQSSASVFGLRMAQLDVSLPVSFSHGAMQTTLASAVLPDDPTCNLVGNGTFSWLLQFDPAAGTLVTGGARPPSDPSAGYAFDDEMITSGAASFHVAKVMLEADETSTCAFSSSAADLVMPAFLDAAGANVMLLPLHQVTFANGRISADNGCIGRFDLAGLSLASANTCQPNGPETSFVDGAGVSGFFVLAEADTVEVPVLGQSLCVLLSGDPQGYGDGATPVAHCKRDAAGDILFKGDWCAETNMKATPACEDALRFSAQFAAVGAKILP
jgi:hypothetical protein